MSLLTSNQKRGILSSYKGRGWTLSEIINKLFLSSLAVSGMKGIQGGCMEMFTKHVNYNDLTAFEAVSMAVIAVAAVANGVVLALQSVVA
jgi:hypothetical protein